MKRHSKVVTELVPLGKLLLELMLRTISFHLRIKSFMGRHPAMACGMILSFASKRSMAAMSGANAITESEMARCQGPFIFPCWIME